MDYCKINQVVTPIALQFFWSVAHLFMGHTLYLTFRGLLRIEPSYRCRIKEGCWGGS